MIASWMLYAVTVGVVLALAARVLDAALAPLRLPTRFVWAAALAGVIGLTFAAPFRHTAPELVLPLSVPVVADPLAERVAAEPRADTAVRLRLQLVSERVLDAAATRLARGDGRLLVLAWVALSLVIAGALLATLVHYRALRRRWRVQEVAGTRVRIAPGVGPAVLGLIRPEIVLPEWLLSAPAREQQLVVQHEREHVAAGDHALLAAGSLALVLLPWNPAVWWLLGRLRLAVELDCDARVLRRGAEPLAYGTVLVDIAGRRSRVPRGAAALADTSSQLERRLRAMTARHVRFAAARGTALGGVAGALVLAACETALPTGPEIDAMDATRAAELAGAVGIAVHDASRFYVDDVEVDAGQMPDPAEIARIEIVRRQFRSASGHDGEVPDLRVYTRAAVERELATRTALATQGAAAPSARGDAADEAEAAMRLEAVRLRLPLTADHVLTADSVVLVERARAEATAAAAELARTNSILALRGNALSQPTTLRAVPARDFDGILLIDDVRVDVSALRRLAPDAIEAVEIIKGEAAARLFSEPAAANGVIRITTKAH